MGSSNCAGLRALLILIALMAADARVFRPGYEEREPRTCPSCVLPAAITMGEQRDPCQFVCLSTVLHRTNACSQTFCKALGKGSALPTATLIQRPTSMSSRACPTGRGPSSCRSIWASVGSSRPLLSNSQVSEHWPTSALSAGTGSAAAPGQRMQPGLTLWHKEGIFWQGTGAGG